MINIKEVNRHRSRRRPANGGRRLRRRQWKFNKRVNYIKKQILTGGDFDLDSDDSMKEYDFAS